MKKFEKGRFGGLSRYNPRGPTNRRQESQVRRWENKLEAVVRIREGGLKMLLSSWL